MSEYIIEWFGIGARITELMSSEIPCLAVKHLRKERLREKIVRCRDCKDYRASDATCHSWQWHNWDAAIEVEPDGFCAWGERANFATCECGEDIELGNRESAVCPRCNRTVRA